MHKVLQAIVDTFLLAAGSAELGSAGYSPNNRSRDLHRHTVAKPLRAPAKERADPQPFRYANRCSKPARRKASFSAPREFTQHHKLVDM